MPEAAINLQPLTWSPYTRTDHRKQAEFTVITNSLNTNGYCRVDVAEIHVIP